MGSQRTRRTGSPTSATRNIKFLRISLHESTSASPTHNVIPLDTFRVKFKSVSNIKFQNRTKSAEIITGNNEDGVDKVDNQPMQGHVINIRGGVPHFKETYKQPDDIFGILPAQALINVTGSLLSSHDREPFVHRYFNNGQSTAKVVIQPGEIKRTTISHEMNISLNAISSKFRYNGLSTNVFSAPGKVANWRLGHPF